MKTIIIFLLTMLNCSCHQAVTDSVIESNTEPSYITITRRDEIDKIFHDNMKITTESFISEIKGSNPDAIIILAKSEIDLETYERQYPNTELLVLTDTGAIFRGPLTREQVEQEMFENSLRNTPKAPYGLLDSYWKELPNLYKKGDRFYYWESSIESWVNLSGIKGYLLMRKNKELGSFITGMN
jgi:hypothetical protein